jgi:hypothetical protein
MRLHAAGGVPLMRAVLYHAEVLSLQRSSVSVLRDIEVAWSGVDGWQG